MDTALVVAALNTTARLLEEDESRCAALYGAPVGIPVSMADHLIGLACTGPIESWRLEWARRAREDGVQAASTWAEKQQILRHQVFHLLFPAGLHSRPLTADEVREVAERLAVVQPAEVA